MKTVITIILFSFINIVSAENELINFDVTFSMEVYESTKKTENFWVEKGQCIMFNKNQF